MKQYGRGAKLLITHKDIPDLQFQGEREEETLEVDEVNIQEPRGAVLEEGGDEHSTPSNAKHSDDVTLMPIIDIKNMVQANIGEGDDHLTPSKEQRGERECGLTDNGFVTKQPVTKQQGIINNEINVPKLGWFGTQVTYLVETMMHTGSKIGTGGKVDITNKCKSNSQSQSEFSFFL